MYTTQIKVNLKSIENYSKTWSKWWHWNRSEPLLFDPDVGHLRLVWGAYLQRKAMWTFSYKLPRWATRWQKNRYVPHFKIFHDLIWQAHSLCIYSCMCVCILRWCCTFIYLVIYNMHLRESFVSAHCKEVGQSSVSPGAGPVSSLLLWPPDVCYTSPSVFINSYRS